MRCRQVPRRTGSRRAARRSRNRRSNRAAGSRARRASSRIGRARRRPRADRATAAGRRAPAATACARPCAWPSTASASASSPRFAGALVGDIGGGRGALEQERPLVVIGGADLQDGARQPQPGGAVGRRGGDDLAEHLHAGAEIVLRKGGVGVAPDLRHRLGRGARVGLDLGLELDRASARSRFWNGLSAACAVRAQRQTARRQGRRERAIS